MTYDYFYGQQAEMFTFYRVPKVLFTEDCFWNVSTDAKLLYGILLDRMNLSARNGWLDEEGRVYIIFTIEEIKGAYEDLIALTNKLTTRFSELSDSIKAAEKRMVEIGALQTHINNYSKTRKTYEAYRKSGYSKKFFEEHRDELMLHKAAKQAFDQLDGKKVPSRQVLHEEFNRLLIEKKQAYAEYRQVKKEMQEYLIAKQTVETILNIDKKKEQEREEKKPLR